jgi:endoglucanase Acf2
MTKKGIKELVIRLPLHVHAVAVKMAKEKGISLNKFVTDVMAGYTGESLDTDIIDEFRRRIEALEKEVFKKKEKK